MYNINDFVKENKKEVYDLIEKNGGRIDFMDSELLKNEDDICPDDVFNANTPYVCLETGDGISDFSVLAADIKDGNINFLIWNAYDEEMLGWYNDTDCIYNSENYVYEEIANRLNK